MYKGKLENTGQASECMWFVCWAVGTWLCVVSESGCHWVAWLMVWRGEFAGGGSETAGSKRAAREPRVSGRSADVESAASSESCEFNRILCGRRPTSAGVRIHAVRLLGGSSTW